MGVFRQFPYSNFHEMNMDEIIKIVKNMLEEWAQYYNTWDNWKEQVTQEWSEMQNFINNYFDNLNVQTEINNKITSMVNSGEFAQIVDPYVPPAVASWLADHITQPVGVVIDTSLTVAGACADARVTGYLKGALINSGILEEPSFTTQTGVINSGGSVIGSAPNSHTSDIPVYAGDVVFADVYSYSGFSLVAKHENGAYSTLKNCVTNGQQFFAYEVTDDMNISVPFQSDKPFALMILRNVDFIDKMALQPALTTFDTIGDANALIANRTYLVYGHDVVAGSNLPNELSSELDAWPGEISTIQSTYSRGYQLIISTNNIFFRTVTLNAGVVTSGSTWRTVENSSTTALSLQPANTTFDTVGDANALNANRTYLVYGHDVVAGSNLPNELSSELDAWPAEISTIASTPARGYQIIVSTNNIFFRTVSINNGVVNSGSTWRTVDSNNEMLASCPMYADYENFYATANGAFLADSIQNGIDCTPTGVYGAHESNIYVYNNNIYLICATNKIDSSEDQTKYNLELIKTDISGTIISHTPICSVGDTINGDTIQRCQASFILPVNDEIHIYCDLGISTGYKLFHTVYDITADTFSSFDDVYYIDADNNTIKADKNGEQYIAPSWFPYSTHSYCTAVFFNKANAGIAYTDDFTTFEFLAFADMSLIGAGGEMTASYISDYNKFVIAFRTPNIYSYLIVRHYDITNSRWEHDKYVPDATARPMFFRYDGDLYLLNNAPYTRKNITLWKYLFEGNWNQNGILEPIAVAKLSDAHTYMSISVSNNTIYMASIGFNLTKIIVATIPIESVTNDDIEAKMLSLFS